MDPEDFPLFERLNDTQRKGFIKACKRRTFEPEHVIIKEATSGDRMFMLIDGTVDVFLEMEGEERIVAQIAAPAVLGEMELLTGQPRTASVRTVGAVEMLEISFEDFQHRLDDGDPAALKIMHGVARQLAQRLQLATRKLGDLQGNNSAPVAELHVLKAKLFSEWSF